MFETSGTGDEGWGATPPPPAADRLWRHPSEMASAAVRAPAASRSHRAYRFSLGTVVVAGSLGALAMFASLAAMGLITGPATVDTEPGTDAATGTAAATGAPAGVVSVRLRGGSSTTFGSGIVVNDGGDIVTTLVATAPDGSTLGSLAVERGDARWADAVVVAADPVTGLTLISPSRPSVTADRADVVAPALGQSVDMARPGPAAVGAGTATDQPTRITSTNACLSGATSSFVGLLTLTSARTTSPTEVAVDPATGAVAGLVLPVDDNLSDEMSYAVPADLAVSVGRQLAQRGHADHGTLAATLAPTADHTVVVTGVLPTATPVTVLANNDGARGRQPESLAVGDEVLTVDGRPVHSIDDVTGALLGASGGTVPVTVRRDNRRHAFAAAVVVSDAPAASTTTLP